MQYNGFHNQHPMWVEYTTIFLLMSYGCAVSSLTCFSNSSGHFVKSSCSADNGCYLPMYLLYLATIHENPKVRKYNTNNWSHWSVLAKLSRGSGFGLFFLSCYNPFTYFLCTYMMLPFYLCSWNMCEDLRALCQIIVLVIKN